MRRPNYKRRKTTHEDSLPSHHNGTTNSLFTEKPSAVFTPKGGRSHTLSVAIPGSIIANAHSVEQKTLLAGVIARALAVFCVDEVVVFDDDENGADYNYHEHEDHYSSHIAKIRNPTDGSASSPKAYTAYSDPSHFLTHILSYLETPPYLRKHLFPIHSNLRTAGLLPSLDMPHHLRAHEWCDFREGIVVSSPDRYSARNKHSASKITQRSNDHQFHHRNSSTNNGPATIVDTGLSQKIILPNTHLPEHARVTVRFPQHGFPYAEPVHSSTPRVEAGYYWGYYVRRCRSLSSVFTECTYDGGYDLSFGTSERGMPISTVLEEKPQQAHDRYEQDHPPDREQRPPDFQHILVVFGGVAGIEAAVRNDPQLRDMAIRSSDADKLFDYWVNFLPGQGSRTIRTEEAVWMGLTSLHGLFDGTHQPRKTYRYHHDG
ncbi:RNA methyltransferase [Aspergillus neoniger CBS 115656]|uniref:Deoxyribose-phosphate aldolase 2 n=1 Tax=Aspergillus neoniger (strain CBS 115656) TaxID=1448310 RepID=A0A318YG16_ASPNB|nr:deoxyribose-phosphate aldolase 2 [Aspergillus neoniger CBS 115656]PYH33034.1 deoxyribose-phosphate aldolase 2 [Aspergillus neoniger CBS 115656]